MYNNNQRDTQRLSLSIPIDLIFGTQITLRGQIKDISLKGAFINIKGGVHMALHDKLEFIIKDIPGSADACIQGTARISRVTPGEGIAIYFTRMDETSTGHLQRLVGAAS